MDTNPSTYRLRPWHAAAGACLGLAVFAAIQYAALVLAYGLAKGEFALEPGPVGSSYFADDIASVPARSVTTMLVALPCWGLIHYYGRRGPLMALFYALVVSWVGFVAMEKWAGPLDAPAQYLAFAAPAVISLMLVWRLSYRRERRPSPAPGLSGPEARRRGPWQA